MKVNILKLTDPDYPPILRHIPEAPEQLFWTGTAPNSWLDKPRVAVVGSRKSTTYGRAVTEALVSEMARAGIVIISGLALGIDAVAHRSALDAGGLTMAVLPTSLDQIYPTSHLSLAHQIIKQGGTLISEYPAGSVAYKANFTARNRIVSGLSDGVIVTEAARRSGTMNTARYALEQGKTVMAVPGNITSPGSEGTNNLIKSGALPVTSADDIFFALGISRRASQAQHFHGTPQQEKLMSAIAGGVNDQEELALQLKIKPVELNNLLTELEINGFIKPAGGGQWLAI